MIHFQTEEPRNRYVIVANPDLIAIKDPDTEELIQLRCLGCQSLFPPKSGGPIKECCAGPHTMYIYSSPHLIGRGRFATMFVNI